jgi:hypothetical protein
MYVSPVNTQREIISGISVQRIQAAFTDGLRIPISQMIGLVDVPCI